jgi:hypothetical protein
VVYFLPLCFQICNAYKKSGSEVKIKASSTAVATKKSLFSLYWRSVEKYTARGTHFLLSFYLASPTPTPLLSPDPRVQERLEAKSKEKRGVRDPKSELIITTPYVHSRVDSNTFKWTWGIPLPELATATYLYLSGGGGLLEPNRTTLNKLGPLPVQTLIGLIILF